MFQLDNQFSRYDILQELLRRKKATESLIEFTKFTKPDYQVNWHHELICNEIDDLLNREWEMLIVSTPPRFGKSEIVSRRLPAYELGKNPDSSIIACSYAADLSSRMNRDVQRIIDDPLYSLLFPDTRLNSSNVRTTAQGTYLRNSDIFEVVGHKGVYRSCGIGGGITGMGFSGIGIIDDPIKNREEAESITVRDKIFEWYTDVFLTRRENNAPILITMTRWHEDDLTGRIIDISENELGTDKCKVITLPALSEEEIPEYDIRTEPNQSLWESKYPVTVLNKIKATVPVYTWLSLYQQRPSAAKGNIFEREFFQYFTESDKTYDLQMYDGTIEQVPKTTCVVFQTCDPAGTAKTKSDFFVLSTWALTPKKDLLLLDVFRTKIEGPDHVDFIKSQRSKWNPSVLGFESVSIGKTTYQNLERERFPLVDLDPKGDKFTRGLSAAITLKSRKTYFRFGAHWLNEWEEELLHFPNGAHDDQVDTFSYAEFMISNALVRIGGAAAKYPTPEGNKRRHSMWETSEIPSF